MDLFTSIGCSARDLSGERKGQTGENIDIKLWYSEEEVIETEPFAGIEVKKVGGIDKRALEAYHADTWKARRPIKVIRKQIGQRFTIRMFGELEKLNWILLQKVI